MSPPQPFKSEDRKVLIGAREPMTKEHMVMELHLEDTYTTVDCKEFLRVMQVSLPASEPAGTQSCKWMLAL